MKTNLVEYKDGDVVLEGFCAFDEKKSGNRPLILVVHDWSGRNEFAEKKAQKLAELGYIGFAVDMFGKGKIGKTKEEKMAFITPFMNDRELLKKRILAALTAAKKIPNVDTKKTGAIGFCFGGLCVLDLARSGAEVTGVVSFHGLLNLPPKKDEKIHAKVLVLHGHDDPMVQPDAVLAFQKEMTNAKVDWQMVIYGNTMHAFTNPIANDPDFGTVYSACADKRSWIAMKNFFEEIFA